jgi:sugar transferase (PEP-CTERM system associated)
MVNVFVQGANRRSMALLGCESVFIIGAVTLSAYLLLGDGAAAVFSSQGILWKSVLIAFVCQICLYYADLYEFGTTADPRDLFARILKSLGVSSLILATLYFWFPNLIIGQGVVALAVVLAVALVIGWRIAFVWLARRLALRQRFLIIGTNATVVSFAGELQRRHELGIDIVGFIDPDSHGTDAAAAHVPVIGRIEDIPAIVLARSVDRVVVSLADARGKLPMATLLQMKLDGVTFDHLASVYEEYTGKIAVENLRPSWLIFADGFRKTRRQAIVKRTMDVCGAAAALILLSPVMLVVALAVRLTSPGAVLYRQRRVGQHGRVFEVYKFRSMREDAEAATGPVWASKHDARITPAGSIMRQTRLDELPQLWSILCGHMSLVGPRPERPEFVSELTKQIPFYAQRHIVKPGLTGWAQVRYTYGASVQDAMEKLQYDLFYIKHMSMLLDLMIMLETVKTVLLRRGT